MTSPLSTYVSKQRLSGDGPTYFREFSGIDAHRFSFFPDSANIWITYRTLLHLMTAAYEDMDIYSTQIQQLNLIAYDMTRELYSNCYALTVQYFLYISYSY